ncbi:hypothetical protein [Oceanobacillus senegalensis]|uniref:hypothetical protein n=1 Tax=Oceanobacillus senegalensis TaxID=1936063 RepID=UPI000A311BB8|nr:hypothetical protein [Oceanobacillus senegalensis]
MLYIWNIERIVKATLKELNFDINYESNNDLTVPMSYNVSTKTIKFNYLKVNGYIGELFKLKESDENIVKLILYRVLGYYLDFKKNKRDLKILKYGEDDEIEELQLEIEANAWEYGRTLVPESLVQSYDKIREFEKMRKKGVMS